MINVTEYKLKIEAIGERGDGPEYIFELTNFKGATEKFIYMEGLNLFSPPLPPILSEADIIKSLQSEAKKMGYKSK